MLTKVGTQTGFTGEDAAYTVWHEHHIAHDAAPRAGRIAYYDMQLRVSRQAAAAYALYSEASGDASFRSVAANLGTVACGCSGT